VSAVIWPGGSPLAEGVTHARHAWKPGGFFWGPVRTLTSAVLSSDAPGGFDGASSGELSAASSRLSEYIGISSVCKNTTATTAFYYVDCDVIGGRQEVYNVVVSSDECQRGVVLAICEARGTVKLVGPTRHYCLYRYNVKGRGYKYT